MRKYKAIICLCMALTILCGSSLTAFASETVETEEITENETVKSDDNALYYGDAEYDADNDLRVYILENWTGRYASNGWYHNYTIATNKRICLVRSEVNGSRYGDYYSYVLRTGIDSENDILTSSYADYQILKYEKGSAPSVAELELSIDSTTEYVSPLSVYYNLSDAFINTSIPIFDSEELAYNYLSDGDESGIVNKPPVPEEDLSFAFVDFECNEYVSATWSGTTLDDKKDTFDDMGFEVNVAYAYDNSFQIAVNEVIVANGDISANRWSRMQKALQHEDETLYLRAVSFTPYYEKYGQICRGKSEIIWLKMDGNKDYLPNDELTMIEDSSFYLRGVSVENSALGLVDGDVRSHISWTGTTKDDMIVEVPLDKTYADILCLCYTPTYKITYVDLYELDPEFMGGKPLPLRKALNDSTQAFYINYTDIDEAATAQGLNFGGKLYITPYFFYEPDNAIYKGAVTVIDVLDNEIEKNPDTGDIYVPDISITPTPSANPSISPDMGEDDDILSDDLDFEKALPTFWKMLKSLWASMGQFPGLMYSLFPYLPKELYYILGIMLIGVIIFRFIGR